MIKFKEGGLIDRWITVYGRCPEEGKNNFCTVWWRAVVGLIVVSLICVFPTIIVLSDLHIYFTKVAGVDSLLFSWLPSGKGSLLYVVPFTLLAVFWVISVMISWLVQVGFLAFIILYLGVSIYNWLASIVTCSYPVKSYFEPLGRVSSPISKVTRPLRKSVSTGVSNVKEIYKSIKDKYCPTVVWVKEEDK